MLEDNVCTFAFLCIDVLGAGTAYFEFLGDVEGGKVWCLRKQRGVGN